MCGDYLGSYNPRDREGVLLKPTWVVDKELDRMGFVGLGLLIYDYKST
jgi:hypothetical protein